MRLSSLPPSHSFTQPLQFNAPGRNQIRQSLWRLAGRAQFNHTIWSDFYKVTQHAGPRRLLLDALEHVGERAFSHGLSIDLGAGAGAATRLLHDRTHWRVHAIDNDPAAEHFFTQRFGETLPARVSFDGSCFLSAHLPAGADFIWSGLALPYVPQHEITPLWARIKATLAPGGVFAGDFFGPDHGHFGRADMNFHHPEQLDAMLAGLDVLKCERITRPSPFSKGRPLMMDCYHVIARKPAQG